jgi:hypothetical protein
MSRTPQALAAFRFSRLAAAVGRRLTWRLAIEGDVALQHRQEPLAVGRVTRFDDKVEDQAASASGQVEFMTVFDVAAALDDDVGLRLEQANQLVTGRYRLAGQDPPLGLGDDPFDQRPVVADHGLPGSTAGPAAKADSAAACCR